MLMSFIIVYSICKKLKILTLDNFIERQEKVVVFFEEKLDFVYILP